METLKIYMRKLTLEEFIEKAHKVHGNKFDYSKVIFKGLAYKITIICPNGHEFEQLAGSHLNGRACPECRKSKPLTTKTFIDRAIKVHKDKEYNYSRVVYINYTTAVEIGCPIHGYFWQKPGVHLRTGGCLSCYKAQTASKAEIEVKEYIKSIYSGEIIDNSRKIIAPYELDIYLPELKLAFEYDGTYWHNLREQEYPGYHAKKDKLALKQNIKLIHIKEKDWTKNQAQIKFLIQEEIKKS